MTVVVERVHGNRTGVELAARAGAEACAGAPCLGPTAIGHGSVGGARDKLRARK